jgi:DNA-binding transcriptional LysR family regulator
VALIERSPHGSRLTARGELVAGWTQAAVDAAAALDAGITSLRQRNDAMVRVAASMTVAEYLLPGWLTALRGRYPEPRSRWPRAIPPTWRRRSSAARRTSGSWRVPTCRRD